MSVLARLFYCTAPLLIWLFNALNVLPRIPAPFDSGQTSGLMAKRPRRLLDTIRRRGAPGCDRGVRGYGRMPGARVIRTVRLPLRVLRVPTPPQYNDGLRTRSRQTHTPVV